MMTASELIAGLTTDAALNLRDAASKMYLFRVGGSTWDALPAADKTLLVTASAVAVVESQTPRMDALGVDLTAVAAALRRLADTVDPVTVGGGE